MNRMQKIIIAFLVAMAFVPRSTHAATFGLSPSSSSPVVGSTVRVTLSVSSADQALNAASGVLSFPTDKLEVVSLSKTNSIFNLWVQEPTYSNAAGTVNFEGVVLNPGFTGTRGTIISVLFRVKAQGTGLLSFSSGSVLANDGQGTDILTGMDQLSVTTAQVRAVSDTTVSTDQLPSAPTIVSSTHADSQKWYVARNAEFSWNLPAAVSAVRLSMDANAQGTPLRTYSPAITTKKITNLADGTWYFHARFQNKKGWGPIAHFAIHIDTMQPHGLVFSELPPETKQSESPSRFMLQAQDNLSGIDHFAIRIDSSSFTPWNDPGNHVYEASRLEPGSHIMTVAAFDKAGNMATTSAQFLAPEPVFAAITDNGGQADDILIKFSKEILIPLVGIALILLFLLKRSVPMFRPRPGTPSQEAFRQLKESIKQHVEVFEKNRIRHVREEDEVLFQLKQSLAAAERLVASKKKPRKK
jgi:hypothetical protein